VAREVLEVRINAFLGLLFADDTTRRWSCQFGCSNYSSPLVKRASPLVITIKPMSSGQARIAQYRTSPSKAEAEIDWALSLLVD
jgi:hypothetical protein